MRLKDLLPIVNVTFGIFEMLLQSIVDAPPGLGSLSHNCYMMYKMSRDSHIKEFITI